MKNIVQKALISDYEADKLNKERKRQEEITTIQEKIKSLQEEVNTIQKEVGTMQEEQKTDILYRITTIKKTSSRPNSQLNENDLKSIMEQLKAIETKLEPNDSGHEPSGDTQPSPPAGKGNPAGKGKPAEKGEQEDEGNQEDEGPAPGGDKQGDKSPQVVSELDTLEKKKAELKNLVTEVKGAKKGVSQLYENSSDEIKEQLQDEYTGYTTKLEEVVEGESVVEGEEGEEG